jgi:hypothetical protein
LVMSLFQIYSLNPSLSESVGVKLQKNVDLKCAL